MKDFEVDNIFIASLIFGTIQKNHLVIAKNKEEVLVLLEEYYYKPEIQYIVAYTELAEIYKLLANEREFIYVLEFIREPSVNKLEAHLELTNNLESVSLKYQNKDCVFISQEKFIDIFLYYEEEITNPKNRVLISKRFEI